MADRLTSLADCKYSVVVIDLDFSRAFDVEPHNEKLVRYGLDTLTTRWIKIWLVDRTQSIIVCGSSLTWREGTSGVFHSSVLGQCHLTSL